jgi:RNase P subunit RPR2
MLAEALSFQRIVEVMSMVEYWFCKNCKAIEASCPSCGRMVEGKNSEKYGKWGMEWKCVCGWVHSVQDRRLFVFAKEEG